MMMTNKPETEFRILAEFLCPKTFDGLCIPEPVLNKEIPPYTYAINFPPAIGALKRRDTWRTRYGYCYFYILDLPNIVGSEDCFKALDGRPFWKDFHIEALENYVVCTIEKNIMLATGNK